MSEKRGRFWKSCCLGCAAIMALLLLLAMITAGLGWSMAQRAETTRQVPSAAADRQTRAHRVFMLALPFGATRCGRSTA